MRRSDNSGNAVLLFGAPVLAMSLFVLDWSTFCVQSPPSPTSHPYVCFVEALRGGSSCYAPPYGEVVLMDITSLGRQVLTTNQWFEISPSILSNGSSVVFESKRSSEARVLQMGSVSNLYSLDLVSSQESLIELDIPSSNPLDRRQARYPSAAPTSNRIAFIGDNIIGSGRHICILDRNTGKIEEVCDNRSSSYPIVWSNDEKTIAFEEGTRNRRIKLVELSTRNERRIAEEGCELQLGDLRNDTLLYSSIRSSGSFDKVWELRLFSLSGGGSTTILSDQSSNSIQDPRLGPGTTVLFMLDSLSNSATHTDLYAYDWSLRKTTRLTWDGRPKSTLSVHYK
jgi:Tol biopolymer transport system component